MRRKKVREIHGTENEPNGDEAVRQLDKIAIQQIHFPAHGRPINEETVKQIAQGIRELGLHHPITVRHGPGLSGWTIIDGQHRLEAVKRLGWEDIDCHIMWGADADTEKLISFSANALREDLSALERAEAINHLVDAGMKLLATEPERARDRKKLGRPGTQRGRAIKELPLPGKSSDKRREANRCEIVRKLTPHGRDEIFRLGLEDNFRAVTAICKQDGREQVKTAQAIASGKSRKSAELPPERLKRNIKLADVEAAFDASSVKTLLDKASHKVAQDFTEKLAWQYSGGSLK